MIIPAGIFYKGNPQDDDAVGEVIINMMQKHEINLLYPDNAYIDLFRKEKGSEINKYLDSLIEILSDFIPPDHYIGLDKEDNWGVFPFTDTEPDYPEAYQPDE